LTVVLLALAASFAWGFADFGAGAATRRLHVFVVAAISQTAGLAVAAAVVLVTGRAAPPAAQLAWGLGAGLVGVVGLSAFYRALAVGTMGIVGPITATAASVPVAYGLARGEQPSVVQGIGVALAVLGVAAASVEPLPENGRRKLGTGVGLALAAALAFGCALIGLSRAASGGIEWAVLTMRLAAAPVVIVAAVAVRGGLPGSSRTWLLLAGVGLVDAGATLLYGAAATRGLLSVVAVLASLYPIVIVVLARLLLSERLARGQLAGVSVALAGVALISVG
jgi:drug/metabolite transporter (DMT)-like permease